MSGQPFYAEPHRLGQGHDPKQDRRGHARRQPTRFPRLGDAAERFAPLGRRRPSAATVSSDSLGEATGRPSSSKSVAAAERSGPAVSAIAVANCSSRRLVDDVALPQTKR